MKLRDLVDLLKALVVLIFVILVLYFGVKKVVYCLQQTGQLDCAVVAVNGK